MPSVKPTLALTTPVNANFPMDVPRDLPSALSSSRTPLSARSAWRDPLMSAGLPSAGLPSAGIHSAGLFPPSGPLSALIKTEDGAQKTPITPPLAYLDFLRSMNLVSPSLASPPLTGKLPLNRTTTSDSSASNTSAASKSSNASSKSSASTSSSTSTSSDDLPDVVPTALEKDVSIESSPTTAVSVDSDCSCECDHVHKVPAAQQKSKQVEKEKRQPREEQDQDEQGRQETQDQDQQQERVQEQPTPRNSFRQKTLSFACRSPPPAAINTAISPGGPLSARSPRYPLSAPPTGPTTFSSLGMGPASPATATAAAAGTVLVALDSPIRSPFSARSVRSPFDWDAALLARIGQDDASNETHRTPGSAKQVGTGGAAGSSTTVTTSNGKSGPRTSVRHIREVITRTVTYTPKMEPAPKGKRRKVDHETAAAV